MQMCPKDYMHCTRALPRSILIHQQIHHITQADNTQKHAGPQTVGRLMLCLTATLTSSAVARGSRLQHSSNSTARTSTCMHCCAAYQLAASRWCRVVKLTHRHADTHRHTHTPGVEHTQAAPTMLHRSSTHGHQLPTTASHSRNSRRQPTSCCSNQFS
jgi:hypothetical protein